MNLKRLLAAIVIPLVFFALPALSQDKTVTGKVTDLNDGSTMANATVRVKGSDVATQTDAKGNFRLKVPVTATTLEVSSIGYTTQNVTITDAITTIQMVQSSTALNEVVVIGYGTVQKKDLTGSVATIGTKDFNQGLSTTPEQLIVGKVAGVTITSMGGQPGQGSVIRIRQGASLNASNDPLIVIDGVPFSGGLKDGGGTENQTAGVSNYMALINPADIETFTVLKDAASTAIYGSRASNGVILITTKKGKSGKPIMNFSTQFTVSNASKFTPVLTGSQFRAFVNTNGKASDIAELGTANTDWQKQIYQSAIGTNNNLSISGSLPKLKSVPYRLSFGYSNQNGILKTDNLERYTGALRISPKFFTDHLKIDLNLNGAISNQRFAEQNAVGAAIRMDPTQSVYSAKQTAYNGYFEWPGSATSNVPNNLATRNPLALLMNKVDKGQVQKVFGNMQFDYKFHFLPELHANLNLGYEGSKGFGTVKKPVNDASAWGSGTTTGQGSQTKYLQNVANSTLEFYLNYNKDIKSIKSNINATAGYGYYDYLTTNNNYASLYANGDTNISSKPAFAFDKPRYTLLSYYGRLIYTFDSKYILAASFRTDGSSRFSAVNRWGYFPTVALTWKLKQEQFLESVKAISDLKLRLSYGVTGQQAGIALYSYIPNYSLSTNASLYQLGNKFYSLWAPVGYNSNIKWEQTATFNVGLDYGFLNNRISGAIDIYNKNTTNLLNTVNVTPGTNFANQITANVGEMNTKGIEFLLNATAVKTRRVSWDLGFNFTYSTRKITKLTGTPDSTYIGIQSQNINGTGNYIQISSVGYQPNAFYVNKQVYDKLTGKPIENLYEDLNRDGSINTSDFYRYKSPYPRFTIGFSTSLKVDKWTVSTVLHGNIGNYVYNQVRSNDNAALFLNPLSYLQNGTKDIYNTNFKANGNEIFSDYYLENASFLKMDNVGVSYDFGKIVYKKYGLTANVSVQNVFTITKYIGLDPEVYSGVDNNFYPRPRIFMLGLNLSF